MENQIYCHRCYNPNKLHSVNIEQSDLQVIKERIRIKKNHPAAYRFHMPHLEHEIKRDLRIHAIFSDSVLLKMGVGKNISVALKYILKMLNLMSGLFGLI